MHEDSFSVRLVFLFFLAAILSLEEIKAVEFKPLF